MTAYAGVSRKGPRYCILAFFRNTGRNNKSHSHRNGLNRQWNANSPTAAVQVAEHTRKM